MEIESKKNSLWKLTLRRFYKNKLAVFGTCIVIAIILVALVAPLVAPYRYDEQHLADAMKPPNSTYIFGTDTYGRDVFSRVIYGAQISLLVGFAAALLGMVIGVAIGTVAGYSGGAIDNILMRAIDVILAIPSLLLAISICAMLGAGLVNAIISISIGMIGGFARISRAAVLSVSGLEYIEAAKAVGASKLKIMLRHILPNIAAPLIIQISLNIAGCILAAAGLSFIGLGVQPPTPEWGSMLAAGRSYIRFNWWLTAFPGAAIMLTVYGFNLMGDGLRDTLDPRLKN